MQAVKTIYFDEVLHHCIGGLLGAVELWTWRYNWCWSAFVWTMKKCIVDTLIINYQPLIFLAYYLSRKILFSVSLCFLSFYSHMCNKKIFKSIMVVYLSKGANLALFSYCIDFQKLYFSFYVSYFHTKTAPPMITFDFFPLNISYFHMKTVPLMNT